jgi:hypothetical protein
MVLHQLKRLVGYSRSPYALSSIPILRRELLLLRYTRTVLATKLRHMDIRFGTSDASSLYRACSLLIVAK